MQQKPNPLPLISSASSILIEIHWHRILGAYHAHHAFFFARPLLSITFKPGRKKGSNFLSFLLFFFTYVIPVTLRWSYTWSRQSWVLLCSSPAPKLYALCLTRIFLIQCQRSQLCRHTHTHTQSDAFDVSLHVCDSMFRETSCQQKATCSPRNES